MFKVFNLGFSCLLNFGIEQRNYFMLPLVGHIRNLSVMISHFVELKSPMDANPK